MYSRKFWIKEYIKRYEFVSEFCHGKILDCRFSKSFSYNSAIMLLKDKNEVISYYNKEEQIVSHKITNDKINFQPVQNDKRNFLENFDCIISFEKNFDRLNFEESVNMFSKFLNENGKLIISAINKEKIQVDNFSSVTLSKEEFLKILGKKFTDIELYSQRLLGEQKSNKLRSSPIRKIGAKLLKSVDKNRTFYIKHFQNKMKEIDENQFEVNKIPDEDYMPIRYNEKHMPHYFIAICKK